MAEGGGAEPTGWTGYLAAPGYIDDVVAELADVVAVHDRLVFAAGPPRPAAWAQNTWFDPVRLRIGSIGEGAKALRAMQRNWALYPIHLHRRARLIEAQLPPLRPKPVQFPAALPKAPLGSWTLLDANTIVAAPHCSSPFVHGEVEFVENKQAPPNRAYLKLWEAFTLIGAHPAPGERCLDLGASPGGWSWVLQQTGARVIAVDKAPLDPAIAALPRIEFRRQSAFALDPAEIGPVDWLCSDVVCYPERLLTLVRRWLEAGLARRFVCTLKFQGETDHATARAFAAIPGSRLIHLHHNKHELTWIKL
ncbi:MAG TPA: SAM-dependent methyltransferase [Alphaproteobacteria bacterium]